ncbi:MAG: hypothetical protein QFX32_04955 [Methanolinea sp.]|nr:hypothetical protein [Methanolinea sp.]
MLRLSILPLAIVLVCAAWVSAGTAGERAASFVGVTSVSLEPTVFSGGDSGTITVQVKNSGQDPVPIARAEILSGDVSVLNYQTYDSVGVLGPGNTMTFTFHVRAGERDGIFFPMFYLDFTEAGSLRYPVALEVDSTPVSLSVVDAPGSLSPGTKNRITLSVNNPRRNAVNSVAVTLRGEGIRTTQESIFIGTLRPDESRNVTFEVWAERDTELVFSASYRNGPNLHRADLSFPVTVGGRETAADLVVNNVRVTVNGPLVTVTGDVTNAGLEVAKAVKVTAGSPAVPAEPNPVYVVGALEPDDFSSFEVTCTARRGDSIPLLIQYRDTEGNSFEKVTTVSLERGVTGAPGTGNVQGNSASTSGQRRMGEFFGFGSGIGKVPVAEIAAVVVAAVLVLVAWRKGYIARLAGFFRDRRQG